MALEDKMSQLMRFKWSEEQRLAVLKTTNFLAANIKHQSLLSKEKALREKLQAESEERLRQKEHELEMKLREREIEAESRRQEHEAQVQRL
jgi:hypothetical protein